MQRCKKLDDAHTDYRILYNFSKDELEKEVAYCNFILNFEGVVTKNSIKFYNNDGSTFNDISVRFAEL